MKKTNLKSLRLMTSKLPKTLNEAINYNDDNFNDMDYQYEDDEPQQNNAIPEKPMGKNEGESMDVMAFVDDIRKKSLKGMASLADNPDDEKYQLLKKIWQICDKKPEQQQNVFNQQQMQQPRNNSMQMQ